MKVKTMTMIKTENKCNLWHNGLWMKLIILFKKGWAHDSLIVFSELIANYISNSCQAGMYTCEW